MDQLSLRKKKKERKSKPGEKDFGKKGRELWKNEQSLL